MKLKLFFFLLFTTVILAQDFKTPTDYLTYINNEHTAIIKGSWKYTLASALKNRTKTNIARQELIKDIQSAKKNIRKIKNGYQGDVEYKDQLLQYLDFYEQSLNEEYDKIVSFDDLSEQSYDMMDALIQLNNLVNAKLDAENEEVNAAYSAFVQKYGIELVESENVWNKKIRTYNEISNYHSTIYLIFFKLNFTDLHLSSAVQKGDLGEIQQNSNALIQYADEGLSQLESIEPYNGDYSVINAATKILEYYKKQAEEYIPKLVDFLMFSDKFENAKKSLEAKSDTDRTKEETDNFDRMSKQMENEITTMKKTYFTNAVEKATMLRRWRLAGDDFISRHIPKD